MLFLLFFLGVCHAQTFIPTQAGAGTPAVISNYQRSQCFAASQGMLAATPAASVSTLVSLLPCNLTDPLQAWEVLLPAASVSYEIRLFNSNFCISENGTSKQIYLSACAQSALQLFTFTSYLSNGQQLSVFNSTTTHTCLETNTLGTTCPSGNLVSTSQLYTFRQSTAAGTEKLTVTLATTGTESPTSLSNITLLNATSSSGIQDISISLTPTSSNSALNSPSSTQSTSNSSNSLQDTFSNQTLIIALASVSGFALLVLIIALFFIIRSCRRKTKAKQRQSEFSMRGVENVNVIASKKSRGAQPIVNMNRSLGSSNASNSALIPAPYGSKPTSRSDSPTRSPLSPNMIQKGSLQRQTNQKNPNDTFIVQGYYPTAQSPLSRPLHPSSPLTNQNSGQIQRLNSAQKSVQSEFDLSDYGGGYTPTSIGESSVFERLRGVREERSKAAPQNPKNLYVPAPGTSIASTTPPHSPTSTEGGYIGPQAFGANTSASVIVVESERDVNDEVYTYDTSISHDSRRMTKSSVGFDAYSQRSSSLGFPIHSQRNRRLKTTGPASIFDVLSEAGVDIKSDIYSEKSASTGTIFQTVNLANAVNASDRNIVYNNVLGSPVSVQAASILSDVDGVKKSPLEIATVIWPYISDQDDELVMEQGDLIIVLNKFDDGWGRGWSKKSKKTGFFPLAAVTTTVSELGDFLEKGSSLPRKSRVYSEYNDLDEEEMENRVFGSITEKSYLSRNISDISFTDIDKLKKKENATPLYNFDSVKAQLGEYDLTDLDDPPLPPPRRRTTGLSSRNGTNSFLTSDSSSAPSLFQAPSKNTEKPKSKMTEYGW